MPVSTGDTPSSHEAQIQNLVEVRPVGTAVGRWTERTNQRPKRQGLDLRTMCVHLPSKGTLPCSGAPCGRFAWRLVNTDQLALGCVVALGCGCLHVAWAPCLLGTVIVLHVVLEPATLHTPSVAAQSDTITDLSRRARDVRARTCQMSSVFFLVCVCLFVCGRRGGRVFLLAYSTQFLDHM